MPLWKKKWWSRINRLPKWFNGLQLVQTMKIWSFIRLAKQRYYATDNEFSIILSFLFVLIYVVWLVNKIPFVSIKRNAISTNAFLHCQCVIDTDWNPDRYRDGRRDNNQMRASVVLIIRSISQRTVWEPLEKRIPKYTCSLMSIHGSNQWIW